MITDGDTILEESIGLLENVTLEELLEKRCFSCNFKACHRKARDSLDLIVETWKGKPICLCCLTMKKKCYSYPLPHDFSKIH